MIIKWNIFLIYLCHKYNNFLSSSINFTITINPNMEPKKNHLWKVIQMEKPNKNQHVYNTPNFQKVNERSKGNIDDVFNDVKTKKEDVHKKIQSQNEYDTETQLFLHELEMAVDQVQDMTQQGHNQIKEQPHSEVNIDIDEESEMQMMIIESNPKSVMKKQKHPKLNVWAPGSPGFSQFDEKQFPSPITHMKEGLQDKMQTTRINFLLNFIKCLQQDIAELSEEYQILKKYVKASFFKYQTGMENFIKKQDKKLRDSLEVSLKNTSNNEIIQKLKESTKKQMQNLSQKIRLSQKQLKEKDEQITLLVKKIKNLEKQNQEYCEINFQLEQQISQKDLYVQEKINQMISLGKLRMSTNGQYFRYSTEKMQKQQNHAQNSPIQTNRLTSEEQLQYEQKIEQYELEIQKLSNLVEELGNSYQKQFVQKEQKMRQQKQQLLKMKQGLQEKQNELMERQKDIEEILYQIQINKNEISSQASKLVAKQQEIKQLDAFLQVKMEEMENLQKHLNQRSQYLNNAEKIGQNSLNKIHNSQFNDNNCYNNQKNHKSSDVMPVISKLPLRSSYQAQEYYDDNQIYNIPEEEGETTFARNRYYQKNSQSKRNEPFQRKMSKSQLLEMEYDNRGTFGKKDKKLGINMSAAFPSSTMSSNYPNYLPTSNTPKHYPVTHEKNPYGKHFTFTKSYADDQYKSSKEKLKSKFGVSGQKKTGGGYENIRVRTQQLFNTNIQPRERTKKKNDSWNHKVQKRNQDYNDSKLMQVGSKLDKLRRQIRQQIQAVKK